MKIKIFVRITLLVLLCSCGKNVNTNSERDAMIKTASQFLNVLKSDDTLKAKSMLAYGLLKSSDEIFDFNISSASTALKKYGIPASEKVLLDSSIHNVQTIIAVVFPIFTAANPEDDFQKAVIKIFVQKINGKYEVIFFDNEFSSKTTPIEP